MANCRTLEEISTEYFSEHPEEINDFLTKTFSDYAVNGDSVALLGKPFLLVSIDNKS